MPIYARKPQSDFTPAPEGLWAAVCCDVVDLGLVETQWGNQFKVEIRWQLEEKDPKSGRPFMVVNRYTNSLHEKSRLRPLLEAWRGRKFTQEELDGFDLEKLVGVNCQVQVIHSIKSEGGVFANVQAVVPAARNTVQLRVSDDYIRMCEREKRAELEKHPHGNGTAGKDYQASNDDCPF